MITKEIKVWIGTPKGIIPPVKLSQYDTEWQFIFTVYKDDTVWSLSNVGTVVMTGVKEDGTVFVYEGTVSGSTVIVDCNEQVSSAAGRVECELRFSNTAGRLISTANFAFLVEQAPLTGYVASASEFDEMNQLVNRVISGTSGMSALTAKVDALQASIGSPAKAATAAAMTDHSKIYVYTGSETDWETGHWYYYDSGWQDGGAYNSLALETDKTLSVANEAADAKEVGDWLYEAAEEVNLVHCKTRTATVNGITRECLPNGAIRFNGTATSTCRFVICSGLPQGSYMRTHTKLGGSVSPAFYVYYRPAGGTWGTWTAGQPLVVGAGGGDVCITFLTDTVCDSWTVHFRIYPSAQTDALRLFNRSAVDRELRSEKYAVEDGLECGAMMSLQGIPSSSYGSFFDYRRQRHVLRIGTAPIKIAVAEKDVDYATGVNVYQYKNGNDGVEFVEKAELSLTNGAAIYVPGTDIEFIKITVTISASEHDFGKVRFSSEDKIRVIKNFSLHNPSYYKSDFFSYRVSPDNYTTGQLMLPPNYDPEGKPVPLLLYIHGTGRYATWDMGINVTETGHDWQSLWDYILNEGFAVFDCYPWTAKYFSNSEQVSPYPIDLHLRAYAEGVKHVVEDYNIDGNNIGAFCKSLGGALGYYLMMQRELPLRGIAMLATSVGWVSTIWNKYFIQATARRPIVKYLGLEDDSRAETFITNGSIRNSTCKEFVEAHLDKFGPLNYCAVGVHGATMQQMYEWMSQGRTTAPAWMQELIEHEDMEMWPAAWNNGSGMPLLIEHPELSKYTPIPVKYWYAWDDVNAPAHASYVIYKWLQNGGSPVEWRTLPSGTGGHYATDNWSEATAVTTSGITRLGVAYSGVNITWVEMADFFYKHMQFDYEREEAE